VQGILDSANDPKAGIEIKVCLFRHPARTLTVFYFQEKQALVNRLATADDIAGLASYLVSKEAAKITGKYLATITGSLLMEKNPRTKCG